MKINPPPSPSNVISAEYIIDKHIIQTCGQRACVCDYVTKKQILKIMKTGGMTNL